MTLECSARASAHVSQRACRRGLAHLDGRELFAKESALLRVHQHLHTHPVSANAHPVPAYYPGPACYANLVPAYYPGSACMHTRPSLLRNPISLPYRSRFHAHLPTTTRIIPASSYAHPIPAYCFPPTSSCARVHHTSNVNAHTTLRMGARTHFETHVHRCTRPLMLVPPNSTTSARPREKLHRPPRNHGHES